MARKIDKLRSKQKSAAADEIDILHPERCATIAGRKIVVREYGFIEGMRLRPLMQPFLDDLFLAMQAGQPANYQQALDIIAAHIDTVVELAAVAADVELAWVQSLPDRDGQHLLMLWWGANYPFFMQRNLSRLQIELREAALAQSDGEKSTPPSSPTTTVSTPSAATPNGK